MQSIRVCLLLGSIPVSNRCGKEAAMDRMTGKVAIVTGAAQGIGLATSRLLAKEGAAVAVTDIQADAGHKAVEEINQTGGMAQFWQLDTTDEQAVKKVFGAVVNAYEIGRASCR